MAVTSFQFDRRLSRAFLDFGYDLYRDDPHWIPPLRRGLEAQLAPDFAFYRQPANHHIHLLARSGSQVVGRASAMLNHALRDGDGEAVGTIGFFECVDDYRVAEDLLGAAASWLADQRGIRRLWGPMNFDIWHGYRMMTRGFDQSLFYGEPYNKPYYPAFFERFGLRARQHWHSLEVVGRPPLDDLTTPKAERHQQLIEAGYSFRGLDASQLEQELETLRVVLTQSFGRFLGFTPISTEDFAALFTPSRRAIEPPLFTFAYDESGTLAGFAVAFLDLSEPLRAMCGQSHLLAKLRFLSRRGGSQRILFYLGGVTPEEAKRHSGLGRALFYHIMRQILDRGCEEVVFALMAKGNPVRGFLGGLAGQAQRQYTLYELKS